MVKKRLVKIIGFGFIIFGILWGITNRFSCNKLCETCNYNALAPCYFLFLFVGIIFIVSGASLLLTPDFNEGEVKRKLRKGMKVGLRNELKKVVKRKRDKVVEKEENVGKRKIEKGKKK